MNSDDTFKAIFGIMFLCIWIVNLVKLFTCALNDQVGLAIIHGVGLIFPLTLITVWFG